VPSGKLPDVEGGLFAKTAILSGVEWAVWNRFLQVKSPPRQGLDGLGREDVN
jgi:hypothetical protein